jgi:manganese/zinc/iron transport system substrate-binding protein
MMRLKKVILSCLLPLLFTACSGLDKGYTGGGKVKILSTTSQIHDLVAYVGGERVDAQVLIRGSLDPHSYEIVKGDAEKLEKSSLIFYNGLGLEHGASLSAWLQASSKAIAIGEKIIQLEPNRILKKNEVLDPHIWMDISLWQKGIDPIVEALSEADPEGAIQYKERGAKLKEEMAKAHQDLLLQMQKVPAQKRYLVTSHDAFQYFTRSYLAEPGELHWEDRFAAPEGLAPEGQLNPKDIKKIIDFLRDKKISVIFPESNVSRDSLRKIATAGKEMGLEIRICQEPLYGDAMGGLPYLEMMRYNIQTIAKYL